jgi:hypothetical protein
VRRAFQLIVRQQTKGLEVFTIVDTGEVLPVFTFEEEAEMYFRLGGRDVLPAWSTAE